MKPAKLVSTRGGFAVCEPTSQLQRPLLRFIPLILLSLAVLHVGLTRLSWAEIPFQTDTGIWAYIGGRLLDGAHLYRDLWEEKPPGIYYTFAAVEGLFGNGSITALLWLDALVSLAVMAVTFRLARRFSGRAASAAAVLLLSLVFCHRVLADWGDNVEKFVALFEMSGCLFLFRGLSGITHGLQTGATEEISRQPSAISSQQSAISRQPSAVSQWLACGVLCGCAALFKQTGLLLLLAIVISAIWRSIKRDGLFSRVRRRLSALLIGFAILWCLVVFWMIASGIAREFWAQVCHYEFQRVGSSERSRLLTAGHWISVWESLKLAGVLLGPALLAAMLIRFKRDRRTADFGTSCVGDRGFALNVITIYWLLATCVLAIAPHGYGHYLLQAAPPAAVLTAWLIDQVFRRAAGRTVTAATLVIIMLGMLSLRDHFVFTFDARSPYRRNYAVRAEALESLVASIRQSSQPKQDVMVWPPNDAASFYARRRTPLECTNMEVIYRGRMTQLTPLMDELLRRLAEHPPDVIVDWSRIKYLAPSDRTGSDPVLLTSPEGYSLLEPPNDSHKWMEGRILAPLKRWVRNNYGGQRRVGPCVVFYHKQAWREWTDFLSRIDRRMFIPVELSSSRPILFFPLDPLLLPLRRGN